MGVLCIQLALAAVTAVFGAGPAAGSRELSSTYDEASCATIHAGDPAEADGWDRAAIGEDAPPTPALLVDNSDDCPATPIALPVRGAIDCNDPLVSVWLGEMIGTCDMPRNTALRPTSLKAARRDERRAQRLLAELASNADGAAPLVPTQPDQNDRDASPALLSSTPALPAPAPGSRLIARPASPLRSISHEPLLRPPRA